MPLPLTAWLGRLLARLTREPRYPGSARGTYGRTPAGVYIDAANALQSATVWACHRYLTQTVGQLPVRVRRAVGDGSEPVQRHPVDTLLNWRPNPELAPFQLKETLVGWAIMRGNGVAEIERDAVGRATALWPIDPNRIVFERDESTNELLYRVSNGQAGTVWLKSPDVFHLRGFGNGAVGLSVIEHAAESIGWARATEIFGATFFGNGLNSGGAIEGGNLKPDGITALYARIDAKHRGPANAHRPLYLDGGMKWVKTGTTPDDAQFVATMQHQVEETCRWFGVPPQKVGHLLRMTFNNVEQLSIEVVVDSITPWAIRFEEEANFKLFGQNRGAFFVKLDLKGLLRGAFKDRQEGLQVMRRNGVISADDWAEIEDMKKPGPKVGGDKYIVEGNMTTLEKVGEMPPSPPPAPPKVEQAPAPAEAAAQSAIVALAEQLELAA